MPGILQIYCGTMKSVDNAETLYFGIAELLKFVENEGTKWKWALQRMGEAMDIYGEGEFMGMPVWEFGNYVNTLEDGVNLSWEYLRVFSTQIKTIWWGIYVACKDEIYFTRLKGLFLDEWCYIDRAEEEYYKFTELVFQETEGGWLIYAKDDALLECIASAFSDAQTLRVW